MIRSKAITFLKENMAGSVGTIPLSGFDDWDACLSLVRNELRI